MEDLRCSLTAHSLELRLYNEVGVTSRGGVVLCELIQGCLGRRVRLVAVRCSEELWGESGTVGDTAVTELDNVRHW